MHAEESVDPRAAVGSLNIDPARNPAITDTGTWDRAAAMAAVARYSAEDLVRLASAVRHRRPPPTLPDLTLDQGSVAADREASFALIGLADGQRVLLEFHREGGGSRLPSALRDGHPVGDLELAIHATDAPVLHRYLRDIAPERGPRALGATPRLGIGVRMTSACWPAVYRAIDIGGFAANAIQNSVRELNFLSDVLEGRPPDRNYASGFGMIETGYTGSTFEGLWTCGVLEALRYPRALRFGADADHVQVKRGRDGMARAKRYLDSCRYYSFYTIDLADVLDYESLHEPSDAQASARARALAGGEKTRRQLATYHRRPQQVGLRQYLLTEALVDRLIGKYWGALEALAEVVTYLRCLKDGEPYDLELTIDEHPPEIAAFDCLTSDEECLFVVNELRRRELPVTHLAPNVGIEKGFDYRAADGLPGLERRLRSLTEIIAHGGMLVDVHSADDLTAPTRAAIRRATGGRLHYKISPMLQILFAGVLEDIHPDLFREWWVDAVAYAREEAAAGSALASWCLDEFETRRAGRPSYRDRVFLHYSFRFVGRRDDAGRFVNRARFYSLSEDFHRIYSDRLVMYLSGLADELLA